MGGVCGGGEGTEGKFGSRQEIKEYTALTRTVPLSVKLPMATVYREPIPVLRNPVPTDLAEAVDRQSSELSAGSQPMKPNFSGLSNTSKVSREFSGQSNKSRGDGLWDAMPKAAELPGVWGLLVTDQDEGSWDGVVVFFTSGFAYLRFLDGTVYRDFQYKVTNSTLTASVPEQGRLEMEMNRERGQGWLGYNEAKLKRRVPMGHYYDMRQDCAGAWGLFNNDGMKMGALHIYPESDEGELEGLLELSNGIECPFTYFFKSTRLEATGNVQGQPMIVEFTPDCSFGFAHMLGSKFEAWPGNPGDIAEVCTENAWNTWSARGPTALLL